MTVCYRQHWQPVDVMAAGRQLLPVCLAHSVKAVTSSGGKGKAVAKGKAKGRGKKKAAESEEEEEESEEEGGSCRVYGVVAMPATIAPALASCISHRMLHRSMAAGAPGFARVRRTAIAMYQSVPSFTAGLTLSKLALKCSRSCLICLHQACCTSPVTMCTM